MVALTVGLDIMTDATMPALRKKSQQLTQLFIERAEARCAGHGLTLASPRDANLRGSQVSFEHTEGYALMQALIAEGVIGDFRAPNIVRFGFAPLYLRFVDAWDAAEKLADILETRRWDRPEFKRMRAVT